MHRVRLFPLRLMRSRLAALCAPALALALLALVLGVRPAQAAGVVGTGTPGSCTSAALATAVTGGGAVTFNCGAAPHTIIVDTTLVTGPLSIDGGGLITLDGEDLRQPIYVTPTGDLTLSNITITRGNGNLGGAVFVDTNGRATLSGVTISLSHATGATAAGGAIYSAGTLALSSSVIISNTADQRGGGLYVAGGTATMAATAIHTNGAFTTLTNVGRGGGLYVAGGSVNIQRSSFSANAADLAGAGLYIQAGTLTLTRVSVLENSANDNVPANLTDGGGLYTQAGTVTIVNSTVARNRADAGGGIYNIGAVVTLKNTIVGDNTVPLSTDPNSVLDCEGPTLQTTGFNLIGDGSCLIGPAASDRKLTPPQLKPTAQLGALRFAEPQPGSPAVDTGSNDAACQTPDVRGTLPLGVCDVGAIEAASLVYLPLAKR